MIEKINMADINPYITGWQSGYFKPSGKKQKRAIHKQVRKIKDLDINRKGIYNRIGVFWEWS
jgi:hypothetical protein